jgi:CheY-like chemotaxis protein
MQALGTLAGGIAHDFNNILAAIGGNTSMALEDLPATSSLRPYLLEIQKGSARAGDLVRQILAFSKGAAPSWEVVDPRDVTNEAVALLRAMLPPKIEVETSFAEDIPRIRADSTQLHQIVVNLVTNATHALRAGGIVEVILDAITNDDPSIASITLPAGRYLRLRVIDAGCGMDATTLKHAFDPFFTTRTPGEGTGLGLSVVHGIVESHRGAVDIRSEPGRGTTVTIYLPATDDPAAVKEAPAAQRGHNQRIMYVDDEEALVFLMDRALTRMGYQITAHSNPAAALDDFRRRADDFDIVITDLAMPGLSGADLATELRKVRCDIPIIMTSGYIRSEDVEMASRLQINQLVYKSSTIDRLCEALTREIAAMRKV